ncbi:activated RNA polymerase II transcriptional coactivator p15 [Chelonus insularis]|uniref:activated RNA polymerase II transcriptional coactivator p15 n=1 Tax=Chelonus insularis TaxID=460826 RepID=UPI0015894FD5|nr:activated RNA polymerase II transcriptional coactivator p15 [Chelonus insularis]XP_034945642.1 activated RNA polymerase II transcriptional coactivator p15 [Chelonus insularis]
MPKSREYLSSDDSQSSEEEKPKSKKQKRDAESKKSKKEAKEDKESNNSSKNVSSSSKADEEEPTWELGNMKEVKVREFKGKLYIDIREMYLDKNSGDVKPGRKGISLNVAQFKKLLACIEEVDKAVQAKA